MKKLIDTLRKAERSYQRGEENKNLLFQIVQIEGSEDNLTKIVFDINGNQIMINEEDVFFIDNFGRELALKELIDVITIMREKYPFYPSEDETDFH